MGGALGQWLGLGIWEWREKDGEDGPLRLHVASSLQSWNPRLLEWSAKRVFVLDIAAVRATMPFFSNPYRAAALAARRVWENITRWSWQLFSYSVLARGCVQRLARYRCPLVCDPRTRGCPLMLSNSLDVASPRVPDLSPPRCSETRPPRWALCDRRGTRRMIHIPQRLPLARNNKTGRGDPQSHLLFFPVILL